MLRTKVSVGLLHHLAWNEDVQVFMPASLLLNRTLYGTERDISATGGGGGGGGESVFDDDVAKRLYALHRGRAALKEVLRGSSPFSSSAPKGPAGVEDGDNGADEASGAAKQWLSAAPFGSSWFMPFGQRPRADDRSSEGSDFALEGSSHRRHDDDKEDKGRVDGMGSNRSDARGAALLRIANDWGPYPPLRERAIAAAAAAHDGAREIDGGGELEKASAETRASSSSSSFGKEDVVEAKAAWANTLELFSEDAPVLGVLDTQVSVACREGLVASSAAALAGAGWGALRRWRVSARAVGAWSDLWRVAKEARYAPDGPGYEEARRNFEEACAMEALPRACTHAGGMGTY